MNTSAIKSLLKVALPLSILFASTFVVAKIFGFLSVEQIKGWFEALKEAPPVVVGAVVAVLLFLDLFIAIPNLTVTLLAGYFLGFTQGSTAALIGAVMSGVVGYGISRKFGDRILNLLLKDEKDRSALVTAFKASGFLLILCSRAIPILPEVTACLAGITRMSFARFLWAWLISTVPYTLIATYSGSISSVDDPTPALFAAVGISGLLWLIWFAYSRQKPTGSGQL